MHKDVMSAVDGAMDALDPTRLSETTMLVGLKIKKWSPKKTDRLASQHTCQSMNADSDAGVFWKQLVPAKEFQDIIRTTGRIRTEYYKRTLPWADGGLRIVTAAGYLDLEKALTPLVQDAQEAMRRFATERYPDILKNAPARLGNMFNADEFPTPDELIKGFSVALVPRPFPTDDDMRVRLPEEELAKAKATTRAQVRNAVSGAMEEAWDRVYKVTQHMADKLKDLDPKSDFRNTLIDNVRATCALLPTLNVTGSAKLAKLGEELLSAVEGADAAALRKRDDDTVFERNRVANAAEDVLAKFDKFKGTF